MLDQRIVDLKIKYFINAVRCHRIQSAAVLQGIQRPAVPVGVLEQLSVAAHDQLAVQIKRGDLLLHDEAHVSRLQAEEAVLFEKINGCLVVFARGENIPWQARAVAALQGQHLFGKQLKQALGLQG